MPQAKPERTEALITLDQLKSSPFDARCLMREEEEGESGCAMGEVGESRTDLLGMLPRAIVRVVRNRIFAGFGRDFAELLEDKNTSEELEHVLGNYLARVDRYSGGEIEGVYLKDVSELLHTGVVGLAEASLAAMRKRRDGNFVQLNADGDDCNSAPFVISAIPREWRNAERMLVGWKLLGVRGEVMHACSQHCTGKKMKKAPGRLALDGFDGKIQHEVRTDEELFMIPMAVRDAAVLRKHHGVAFVRHARERDFPEPAESKGSRGSVFLARYLTKRGVDMLLKEERGCD